MQYEEHWNWFAWGKHPALEDFVWAGTQTPLFQRFTKWVDNGFAKLSEDSEMRTRNCSWRFWTKGADKGVVCGLIRNSCDTHGRSFPLLYIGTGGLNEWPSNCPMLPLAFESVWKDVEYVSSARFDSAGQLNQSLQLMQSPTPDWQGFQQRVYHSADTSKPANCEEIVTDGRRLLKVDCGQPENLPQDVQFCHRVTTMGEDQSPMAVFIGEMEGVIAVAMINNALTPADFVWLWNLDQNQVRAKQQVPRG